MSTRGGQSVERKAGSSRDTATIQSPEMRAWLVGSVNTYDRTLGHWSPQPTERAYCLTLATVADLPFQCACYTSLTHTPPKPIWNLT